MKNILLALVALIVLGAGVYFYMNKGEEYAAPTEDVSDTSPEPAGEEDTMQVVIDEDGDEVEPVEVIGTSAGGNDITAYHFGDGEKEVLFIGGTHGGYSFNTALVAFEIIDYLEANPNAIPEDVMVTVIPVFNPDGLTEIVGTTGRFEGSAVTDDDAARVDGRFNANGVDLNRNFDCEWSETGTWQNRSVSGGSAPFSEPEAAALRDYVEQHEPVGAVVYYSQAGGVFSSNCLDGVLPATVELTNAYADAAGYGAYEEFNFYEITGDMVNWMSKERIPAISVLLTNHEETEWSKNQKGVDAVLQYFSE